MIKSFTIRNIATFDANGVAFDNLKQINFLYGTNGSGKTTISNSLKKLSSNCSISWIANNSLDIYVYNKDFKEKNILADSFNGVFTLGEKDLEAERLIKETKVDIENYLKLKEKNTDVLNKKYGELDYLHSSSIDNVWNNSEVRNNSLFLPALEGFRGKKEVFFNKCLLELKNTSKLLPLDDLEKNAKSIFSKESKITNFIKIAPTDLLKEIESSLLWSEKIIGKNDINIADLINHLDISDWVNTGIKYLQSDNDICPFCQKNTIDEKFKKSLESYFDHSYNQKKVELYSLQNKYEYNSNSLNSITSQTLNLHSTTQIYDFDKVSFELILNNLSTKIDYNRYVIKEKIEELSKEVILKDTSIEIDQLNEIIYKSNIIIEGHNSLVKNLSVSKKELTSQIWSYIAQKNKDILEKYLKEKDGISKAITSMTASISSIEKNIKVKNIKIIGLNKNQTNTQTTVDNINTTLLAFGFNGFTIQPILKNKYQLHRKNGTIANKTLSEGEISFITFLYFYHLCKGGINEEAISNNRVVVIDDPISSLDSNILFVVSSLVKDIIHNIKNNEEYQVKQLIVLTHNIYFHKEVSFVGGKIQEDNKVNFWLLRKNNDVTNVTFHGNKNPILSSYELLWRELEEEKVSPISLQNSMRRIIENYFKILGGIGDNDILDKFENPQEKMVCRSLICWVNDGSHCIPDDLYVDGQYASSNEYRQVFKSIFEKSGHLSHYRMMIKDKSVGTS